MAAKKALRAVAPGERRVPKRRLTVTEAAASGSERELLVAMRDRVAKDVENPNTPSRDLAALTRRLIEIANGIAAVDARAKEGDDDEDAADEAWSAV